MKSVIGLKHMKLLHLNVTYEQQNRFIDLGGGGEILGNFVIFFWLFLKIVAKHK